MKSSTQTNDSTIEANESDYLYISASQITNAGKGLYTSIDIYKEETIAIFEGEILSEEEVQKRVDEDEDQYFIAMLDGRILDSKRVECFAKYANDAAALSSSAFKNNSKIIIDDDGNICLTATKKIKSGQEIFCSYGKRYWKKHGQHLN
jgi:hypothetical protein